jgi:hypothetical protein
VLLYEATTNVGGVEVTSGSGVETQAELAGHPRAGARRTPPRRTQWVDGTVSISVRSPDQSVWNTPGSSTRLYV